MLKLVSDPWLAETCNQLVPSRCPVGAQPDAGSAQVVVVKTIILLEFVANVTLKQVPSRDVTRQCEMLQAVGEFCDARESVDCFCWCFVYTSLGYWLYCSLCHFLLSLCGSVKCSLFLRPSHQHFQCNLLVPHTCHMSYPPQHSFYMSCRWKKELHRQLNAILTALCCTSEFPMYGAAYSTLKVWCMEHHTAHWKCPATYSIINGWSEDVMSVYSLETGWLSVVFFKP
jgi:hypothetical protein